MVQDGAAAADAGCPQLLTEVLGDLLEGQEGGYAAGDSISISCERLPEAREGAAPVWLRIWSCVSSAAAALNAHPTCCVQRGVAATTDKLPDY